MLLLTGDEALMGGVLKMAVWIGGIAVAVGGAWAAARWLKDAADTQEQEFRSTILGMVAKEVSTRTGQKADDLLQALLEKIDRQTDSPLLEPIRRIECEAQKKQANEIEVTMYVRLRLDGEEKLLQISQLFRWDELPGTIHRDMITENKSSCRYLLMEQ